MAGLPAELMQSIAKHWGFTRLRPMQERAMQAVLAKRDSLIVMPTGGGKSLCFQAPAVYRGGLTVVISPLIALMKDQVDGLARNGVAAVRLDSTLTAAERNAAMAAIKGGTARLVFTSPERLVNTDVASLLRSAKAHTVAIDEAHCVSHWGHDFRPEYRQLARLREFFPGCNIHAYTATATEPVRDDIVAQLNLIEPEIVVGNFDRPNLTFRILPQLNLMGQLREVIDRHKGDAGIVYCLRRKDVDSICLALQQLKYRAVPYHAGMSAEERKASHEAFSNEDAEIVVATIAFGMGIDRSNVRFVIHAAVPKSIEHYQQETGRAGRDGLPAECVLLYSGADYLTMKSIIEKSAYDANVPADVLATSLKHLEDMARYARGAACRHKAIVRYFGQEYDSPNCAACDLCLGDTQEVPEANTIAQKILSCVARVKESFGVTHVVDVLKGANTEGIRTRKHQELSTYGLLKSHEKSDLRDWVYQLIGQDALAQADGDYPVLKLTKLSWQIMRNEATVRLIQLAKSEAASSEAPSSRKDPGTLPAGADAGLFEHLRQLRRQEASRLGVPPYVVFTDATLAEFARLRPTTPEKMHMVSGVGEQKLRDFAPTFLKAIAEYCAKENLPTDQGSAGRGLVLAKPKGDPSAKTLARKNEAFALFRAGNTLEDTATAIGLSQSTTMEYLADFIREEKPDAIFDWVPEDVCERIAAAAEEHGTERLKPVYLALNNEVPYDQIRLVFAYLDAQD